MRVKRERVKERESEIEREREGESNFFGVVSLHIYEREGLEREDFPSSNRRRI